jgi:hypothetical protein
MIARRLTSDRCGGLHHRHAKVRVWIAAMTPQRNAPSSKEAAKMRSEIGWVDLVKSISLASSVDFGIDIIACPFEAAQTVATLGDLRRF